MTGEAPSRVAVLHVVESFGAGTAAAVHQYVTATPDLEHHLVRRFRDDDDYADDGEADAFASVAELPAGVLAAVRAVRRRIRSLRPDVVHAHSSLGGAFARLAGRHGRPLVVYTPHCFSTEREDLSRAARAGFGLAERLLGLNTDVVAGCSPRETDLGRRLAPRARHVWVPNVTDLRGPAAEAAQASSDAVPTVIGLGRLAPQRDPDLFAAVVTRVRTSVPDVRAVWVGGGDDAAVARLTDADVEVTRWLPRSRALQRLRAATVYVHTAAWDGAPMTLLEAEALDVATVARRTPALVDCPPTHLADDADGLASQVVGLLGSAEARSRNRADWRSHFADHTVARQREALLAAYGLGAGAGDAALR